MQVFEVRQELDEEGQEKIVSVANFGVDSPISSMKVNPNSNSVFLGLASGTLMNIDLTDMAVLHEFISTSNNEISNI